MDYFLASRIRSNKTPRFFCAFASLREIFIPSISNAHEFSVIRLWEQPTGAFLQSTGLLPFAVLSQSNNRSQVLQRVAQAINQIPDTPLQTNVAASTAILAGLVLKEELIRRLMRQDIMQESVIYRAIQEEERQKAMQEVAANMLREGMAIEAIARVTGLSIEQIQQLQATLVDSAS